MQFSRFIKNIFRFLLPVLIIAIAVYGYNFLKRTKPVLTQKPKQERTLTVRAKTVKIADYQPSLRLYGEAIAGRKVEMRALVSGEIIHTSQKLSLGSLIQKGEVLLKIDPFRYDGALTDAKSRLLEAKAKLREIKNNLVLENNALKYQSEQLKLAQTDLQRAVPLAQKGTVSKKLVDDRRLVVSQRQQSVDQRRSNLEIQKAKLEQQQAIITRLEWGVKDAQRNLKDTTLVSPFDAYIRSVDAEVGRIVNANDRVATLLDQNWIDIRFTLTDSQYGRIISSGSPIIGRDVNVNWRLSNTPINYKARIERVSSDISSDTGGIEVYARIKDPAEGTPLRPGTFVETIVPDRIYQNVARLPQTALFENAYVYAIVDQRLQKRKVNLVGSVESEILVTGELKDGDVILITRLSTVGNGVKVKLLGTPAENKKAQKAKELKSSSLNNEARKPQ